MKKGLWGYSVDEVNESLEFLEEQNAALTQKVNKLTAELEQARQETVPDDKAREFPSEDTVKLTEQIETLENENRQWKARAEELESRLAQQQAGADDLEQVSAICRKAYADMAEVKQSMRSRMQEVMESFLSQWTESRDKMDQMFREMADTRAAVKDSFIAAADTILTRFESLDDDTRLLEEQLADMDETKNAVRREWEDLLRPLGDEVPLSGEEQTALPEKMQPEEEDNRPAILRAIQDRKQKSPPAPATVIPAFRSAAQTDDSAPDSPPDAAKELADSIGISIGINPKRVINK